MWTSTIGLVNGKHRYLTAETFGFKVNSNGQQLKRRQQWTIEPFPENTGPDGSISSAASVSSQCPAPNHPVDPNNPCILTLGGPLVAASLNSVKSCSNGSSNSDQDAFGEEHENVAIKSHLNKYLAVDSFGNVTCDSDEKTETARFTITICSMSQGRSKDEHIFWAFKNVERGYYLGTTDDGMICCNAKMPKSRAELWHLHLLPARGASFFALKSIGRKRFARATNEDKGGKQVQLDANISWGPETLFQFKYFDGGCYSLLTSDNKLLTNEGKCIEWAAEDDLENTMPPVECLFTLEYHSGYLAFRDTNSQYLAAAGRSSVLRSRSVGVSRDELFVFESVPIQVSLKVTFNNRWVSIKQGVDLSANQMETSSRYETFQLTYHKQTHNWSIMTQDCNFWTVSQKTNTVSVCRPGDYEGLTRGQFKFIWSDSDATFSLKYVGLNNQERWVSARKSGQLFLSSGSHEPVKFVMRFQNRRLLNLRPVEGNGFVGLRSGNSKQIEANKTSSDSILIEYSELPTSIRSEPGLLEPKTEEISGNSDVLTESNGHKVANVFNVKLNNTKMGASNSNSIQPPTAKTNLQRLASGENLPVESNLNATFISGQKEIDCGIDANNNCLELCDDLETTNGRGGVESVSAPSVASIINSFSNAKISTTVQPAEQKLQNQRIVGSTISKLASSFESTTAVGANGHNQACIHSDSDSASVLTSCSTASSAASSGALTAIQQDCNISLCNGKNTLAEQVAQSECCYMKLLSNNKYLVVGEGSDSSILCDATNKACAQGWIIELRSHNSIAIRASDNQAYMQLGTNGTIFLSRCEPKDASLWEF